MGNDRSVITRFERLERLQQEQEDVVHTHHLPGLADMEIVRRALPLASIAALPSQDRDDGLQDRGAVMQQRSDAYHLMRYVSILEEDLAEKFVDLGGVDTTAVLMDRVSDFWEECSEDREHFREALEYIVQDKKNAQERLASYLSSAAQKMLIVPKLNWPESEPVELSYAPMTDQGVLGYVLMVLLRNNDVSKRLRKCRYRLCGDFFIADGSARGGPKFNYCSDVNRRLSRREQNAAAQQRFRPNRKKGNKKKAKPAKNVTKVKVRRPRK